jgi:cadmium resistance protein CadD (predicted permease)
MSGFAKWCLWIGMGFVAVAVVARALNFIPVTVIAGILGLLGIGMAGYDVLDEATERWDLRRRAAKVRREREQGR